MNRLGSLIIGLLLACGLLILSACSESGGNEEEDKNFQFPTRLAITPDPDNENGVYLFALNYLGGTASILNVFENEDSFAKRHGDKSLDDRYLDVGDYPADLALSESGDRVFICSAQGGDLNVLDVKPAGSVDQFSTRKLTLEQDGDRISVGPCNMISSGSLIYIADQDKQRLLVLDAETETLTAAADLDEMPESLIVSTNGADLYLTTAQANLWRYDAATLTAVGEPLFLDGAPTRLALDEVSKRLFVINREPAALHRINAESLTEIGTPIELAGIPSNLLIVPGGKWIYVACLNGQVYVYDRSIGHFCGASATVPQFKDRGAISDPTIEQVIAKDCVAREQEWSVKYDQSERRFIVRGDKSGKQSTRAYLDQTYISDNGSIQFTINSGTRAPSDKDEFTFETDPGIGPIRIGQLPDGMVAVPDYDDPEFYIIWIANTLSDNLNHITTDEHENLGSVN